jgi:hypothetical protein
MRRIANWLQRLPFGALTRRAFGETFADWRHESRGVGVPGRARATIGALAGLLRVAGRAFGSFEEHPMRNMGRDVRHGLRRLRATPLYAVFAVVTLGLGIGATTAVYSLVHAVVGPPSGVRDVDRIINVYHARPGGNPATSGMSWPDFQDFRAAQTSFAGSGATRCRIPDVSVSGRFIQSWPCPKSR